MRRGLSPFSQLFARVTRSGGHHVAMTAALTLAACGGSTTRDGSSSGSGGTGASAGTGASGGISGSSGTSGAGSGGSTACGCAPTEVCDADGCVPRLRLVSAAGQQSGDGASREPDISEDGRLVAFTSEATNLTPDIHGKQNVFVRFMPGESTTLVSITAPNAINANSRYPALSADGEFATFSSSYAFFQKDGNQNADVFVSDLHSLNVDMLSTTAAGEVLSAGSFESSLSKDSGRMVFASEAGLVPEDSNDVKDVYLVERGGPGPVLISTAAPGGFPSAGSFSPALSADGRFVAFVSSAPDPSSGDDDQSFDVLLKDLDTGTTTRVTPPPGTSDYFLLPEPRVSWDGALVVFASERALAASDTNAHADIYAWERASGTLTLVSVSTSGAPADGDSLSPSVSFDGRFVAFESWAKNLVAGDENGKADVFVRDLMTGATVRLGSNLETDGASHHARISGNGRFVAFHSDVAQLVTSDDNQVTDVFLGFNPLAR